MKERRKFVRLHSRLNVNYKVVYLPENIRSLSKDVSGGGVRIETEDPLAQGTLLQIEVKFPDKPKLIRFTGEVMWSQLLKRVTLDGPPAFDTGLQFVKIDPEDQEYILTHAQMYGSQSPAD